MNHEQYHLGKIAEEAVEVAQRALKAQQFGLLEIQDGQSLTNLERLIGEFHDLFITLENFWHQDPERGPFPIPTDHMKQNRLEKMEKFLNLSKSLKQVEPDTFV